MVMGDTYTNLDSYVNGFKVVSSDAKTVTLENGTVLEKEKCKFVNQNPVRGEMYYNYDSDTGTA